MMTSRKQRVAIGLALTAAMAASLYTGTAQADPKQYDAFVGVGSDTTQDVMNAFAGNANGIQYTPVSSGTATGNKQLISFDAAIPAGVSDQCVTPKIGLSTYTRPNGSSSGRRALFASSGLSSAGWTGSTSTTGVPICATAVDISGTVDFARSSAGPANGDTSTLTTYIPFGRDAMSFGYYRAAGLPVTTLTRAQIITLFTTGPQVIDGVRIVPCGIQTGSGTYQFWQTVITATTAQENTATTECNNLQVGGVAVGRSQESDALQLKTRGDALAAVAGQANSQVVIGYSAANFISVSNGASTSTIPSTVNVGIGSISDAGGGVNLGNPIVGATAPFTPNATFYANSVFGRNVYNVLPTSVATGGGNAAIKALFVSTFTDATQTTIVTPSRICAATSTINTFGFLAISTCGSTTLKGNYLTGVS